MNKIWRFCSLLFLGGIIQAQSLDTAMVSEFKARSIGPAGMSGRITGIDVVRHQPEIIYVASASGGVWKSTSGGTTWEPIFDDQPTQNIGCVKIAPNNSDVIWVGTGEGNPRNSQSNGNGVYRSLDAGRTWDFMGLEQTRNIHRILIHPHNPDIVYVGAQGPAWGTTDQRGVFKTEDGGKTWRKILFVNDSTGIADLVMDPENPNKIIAAMWQFHREPYVFNSGGPGSGLYVSIDGGEQWSHRTEQHGLPKGELGRIGLAIAPSSTNIVYALVEAEKNGLYKSTDGGFNWTLVSEKNIGNRPFYYAELYVDPKNENRIYNLYSMVSRSEDGGKTFEIILPYSGVHPDHHAWYIHPDQPDYIIDGNDGGLNISRDRGETWRFVENLPLAQFYHINYDMQIPYNVYGGMQDNGSWRGPSQVTRWGGIRNGYWDELYFGDGFDVVPDATDPNSAFAMYQGGNVARINFVSGVSKGIQPTHPDGQKLRFNWNAAIAQSPHNPSAIYFGSQYLHRSDDLGANWEIISPDLTTNDSSKIELESGGLTLDVTGAENYCSITTIAPAEEKGVIWVGTDDGKVHLTRDEGNSWTDVGTKIKTLPKNAWIHQIVTGVNWGEVFVVANNYRQHDYKPYLFYSADYGKTWKNLAVELPENHYCLSLAQDFVEPDLLFLGTENGLYISIDHGVNWTLFTNDYPQVSTFDLKIHPRTSDLIIGTFGRAAYILDNIAPIRRAAETKNRVFDDSLASFTVPTAYITELRSPAGIRFDADAMYSGQNKTFSAVIPYHVLGIDSVKPSDTLRIFITNAEGDTIRSIYEVPKADGLNYAYWNLDFKGFQTPSRNLREPKSEPGISFVRPGSYTAHLQFKDYAVSESIRVEALPGMPFEQSEYDELLRYIDSVKILSSTAIESIEKLNKSMDILGHIEMQIQANRDTSFSAELEELGELVDSAQKEITALLDRIDFRDERDGYTPDSNDFMEAFYSAFYATYDFNGPNQTDWRRLKYAEEKWSSIAPDIREFYEKFWPEIQTKWHETQWNPFDE